MTLLLPEPPAAPPEPEVTEGDEVVTVARYGCATAKAGRFSYPIYCTAVYRAVRRVRDGVLTWRRVGSYRDATAGRGITGPMIRRAEEAAAERGVPYVPGVRHGKPCN